MADLFLDPKVLNYTENKYELILMTLRWARQLKSKGAPEPMAELVERALRDIVDGKVTKADVMAVKPVPVEPVEEMPSVVSVGGEGVNGGAVLPPDDEDDEAKGKKKAKKKKDE